MSIREAIQAATEAQEALRKRLEALGRRTEAARPQDPRLEAALRALRQEAAGARR